MNPTTAPDKLKRHEGPTQGSVVQDGVTCPRTSPWPAGTNWTMRLMFVPVIVTPVYILAQTNLLKLGLWLLLFGLFAYPLRYLVCARCPYYGQPCSTDLGKIVPRMFKKQEGKSMRLGLWLDVVSFVLLFVLPLPEVWRWGGVPTILLWCGMFVALFLVMTKVACSPCPLTFCPIGRAGRAFWSLPQRT